MTNIPKIALAFTLVMGSSMMLSTAQAKPPSAEWIETTNPSTAGFTVGANNVQYGPVAAQTVWVYDGANPPGNQDPATILSLVTTKFGLPATGPGSITLTSDADIKKGGKSGSFTVSSSFDYLAIHYGKGELLFHWAAPLDASTVFSFGNLPQGISNYRAYISEVSMTPPISPVPEPETYAMMLAGLGLLGFMARRRKSV
ncbi:MAG: hypothetical protein ACI8WM_002564 [Burkholderiaceae bacterium]|jgi:hypothetical protein